MINQLLLDCWTDKTLWVWRKLWWVFFLIIFLLFEDLTLLKTFLIFESSQKVKPVWSWSFLWEKGIVWISRIMPNTKTCVMELQYSLEWPCQPAFVCNYCLIKHAGQLPGSDWLATDTQLYTECLQPPSQAGALLSGPLQKQLHLKPQQLLQYVIIQYLPLMSVWLSITPRFNWGEVRSLST